MCLAQTTVPTYTVGTFAGSVPNGDGGWAADAILRWPSSLVFDRAGNLYIVDQGNASVRKVTPNGLITTFAGTGEAGFSGDGGPASRAQLSAYLNGLAVDGTGNIYISDGGNNRIRRVSAADGKINTYVDGATLPVPEKAFGFFGIAVDGAGNLYIANWNKHRVYQIAPDGTFTVFAGTGTAGDSGDGGPATQAAFMNPTELYIDASGTMYVTDALANRIRKITSDGTISTLAGTGKAGFGGDGGPATQALLNVPADMGEDSGGNLYFLDFDNLRVRRIAPDGTISTVAGTGTSGLVGDGGPAAQAQLVQPYGLTVSAAGDVYISDWDFAIRVVTAADGIIQTAYGKLHSTSDGVLASEAVFDRPFALAADGQGNFYLGDRYRIRKIDTNGLLSTTAGRDVVVAANTGDGGPATAASIYVSLAVTTDAAGNLYIASANQVRRVDTNGIITTVAGTGNSGFSGDGGPATAANLASPVSGLAVDSSGSLYISDYGNHRIRKVRPDGTISTFAGTGVSGTSGDGGPATAANINQPNGMVFDATGNLFFSDMAANRVRKISPDGTISEFAGNGTRSESGDGGLATKATLSGPAGLAMDSAGNLYIADYDGNALRVVTPDGIIHTIASGNPEDLYPIGSFGGDGGPAIGADYCQIAGVALDGSGNIYLLDNYNERIRVLTPKQ